MSFNCHTLHVRTTSQRAEQHVTAALVAALEREAYEPVKSTRGADRVIRLGRRGAWLTVVADDAAVGKLADAIARATKLPTLEAYCEGSTYVWLELRAGGRKLGSWGAGKRPANRSVEPLLERGDPDQLAAAWDHAVRTEEPELALAAAAPYFGIAPAALLGTSTPRGTMLAFKRKVGARPSPRRRRAKLEIGWPSNLAWGNRHLLFVGEESSLDVQVEGAPRDRTPQPRVSASPPLVEVTGTHTEPSDDGWNVAVEVRAVKPGECTLRMEIDDAVGELAVQVMPQPYRPRAADTASTYALFQMHRREHLYAYLSFRVDLVRAWQWARPSIEQWMSLTKDDRVRVTVDGNVRLDGDRTSMARVEALLRHGRVITVAGTWFQLGTTQPPLHGDEGTAPLAIQLVLAARERSGVTLDDIAAVCDAALRDNVIWSAIAGEQQYMPSHDETAWERATLRDPSQTRGASWQRTHLRGLDAMVWISAELAERIDRDALAKHATLDAIGQGVRMTMPPEAPRTAFAPIEDLLGPLLPGQD